MNKEAMQQSILEALSRKLGDGFHITIQQVLKTNQKLDGLVILQEGKIISPAIYLDSFYEGLENGVSPDDIADEILRIYSNTKSYPGDFDATSILDFSYIRERLYVALVNRHINRELLQDIPHSQFLDDFAVTIRCMVEMRPERCASFLIHNSHLGMWHIEQESLLSLAVQNTRQLLGLDLRNMKDVIGSLFSNPAAAGTAEIPMWVMTNREKLSGAATALFDDVLKNFANIHGSFYVIFSSVHEILLVPTPDNSNIDNITRMNQEVNTAQLLDDEILGTKAYYYDKDKGFIL